MCVCVCVLRWIFPQTSDRENLTPLLKSKGGGVSFSPQPPSKKKKRRRRRRRRRGGESEREREKRKKSTSSSTTCRRDIYMTIRSGILEVPPPRYNRVWRQPRYTFPGSQQYLPAELCTAALPGASSSSSSSSSNHLHHLPLLHLLHEYFSHEHMAARSLIKYSPSLHKLLMEADGRCSLQDEERRSDVRVRLF